MTDKELRKLSRLELLELLLEAGKENTKLKEQIARLTAENKTSENIENLSVITGQVENVLKYASGLTKALEVASSGTKPVKKEKARVQNTPVREDAISDREIYRRMLSFFAENDDKLDVFPEETAHIVRTRINNIFESRKSN